MSIRDLFVDIINGIDNKDSKKEKINKKISKERLIEVINKKLD
jgi:hypothetical protein